MSLIYPGHPLVIHNLAALNPDECAIPSDHPGVVLNCNASLDKTKNKEDGIPGGDIPNENIPEDDIPQGDMSWKDIP